MTRKVRTQIEKYERTLQDIAEVLGILSQEEYNKYKHLPRSLQSSKVGRFAREASEALERAQSSIKCAISTLEYGFEAWEINNLPEHIKKLHI